MNDSMSGPANFNKYPKHSSMYRRELVELARFLVKEIDRLNPEEEYDLQELIAIHKITSIMEDIFNHEFAHYFGFGLILDDWVELKIEKNYQMMKSQRKLVLEDLEVYLSTKPEEF
ncbi:hypothetical protein H0W80_03880 [Candidatus Saccharibacteria bacterium]|nr:hypothetical protein [Candidatus Saccharibacteria bacterium]